MNVHKKGGNALALNIGTQMLVEPAGMGDRFKTDFIGMVRGQFFIVRIPRIPGLNDYLYVDKRVTVRYVHEGHIFGFESKVLFNQSAPFKLLFLKYPDSVETLNLRKCQRVDCYVPVRIGVEEEEQYNEYQGMMLNLSCGGCQVVIDAEHEALPNLSVDDEITVSFTLFNSSKNISIKGGAKNLNISKNRMFLGAMFHELDEQSRADVDTYVSSVADYLDIEL